ncbi:hypothetical protein BMS3Abin03_00873 [bacterium BMS3Abin03]|nr:hypothetical protein BMS3Abin03_00873 [bacterium BMS3Abin03]
MRKRFTIVVGLIGFLSMFLNLSYAQQASDYFPAQTGFLWNYSIIPLDSLNNEVDSLKIFRIDSFAVVSSYEGKLADIVPTKTGPLQTIHSQPYSDSLFYNFDGTDGYEYFRIGSLGDFLLSLDSLMIDSSFSFLTFFKSLEDWYPVYKFAAGVNNEYTILSVDTTIGDLPLRFEFLGERLQDETINTQIGTFDCKKFLIMWKVSYLFPPPIPPVELIKTEDSLWIAQDNWVVLDIVPTNLIDLSFIGIEPFFIPGRKMEILDNITAVNKETRIPVNYLIFQNYPNPFNPSTTIKYQVPERSFVTIKVFDVLGNEVATLINEEKPVGTYEVVFEAAGLSSGIYYYRLQAGNYIETKEMILLK